MRALQESLSLHEVNIEGGQFAEGEKREISVTSKGAVIEANTVLKPGDMV